MAPGSTNACYLCFGSLVGSNPWNYFYFSFIPRSEPNWSKRNVSSGQTCIDKINQAHAYTCSLASFLWFCLCVSHTHLHTCYGNIRSEITEILTVKISFMLVIFQLIFSNHIMASEFLDPYCASFWMNWWSAILQGIESVTLCYIPFTWVAYLLWRLKEYS